MKTFALAILAVAVLSESEVSAASCKPGDRTMRGCNACFCMDGSGYACTTMDCITGLTCRPGRSFKRYCNICRCGADGLVKTAGCTKMACVEGVFNEDGTLKQPQTDPIPREKRQAGGADATCVPGKSFKHYCNSCVCPKSGLRSAAGCTLMGCPEGMWNEDGTLKQPRTDPIPREKRQAGGVDATCVPGTSFKHYCNTCRCGTDGLRASAACTRVGCREGMWNEDGTLKQPQTDPIPREKRQAGGADATCVPGTSFKHYCNTCRCGTDGLRASAACTRVGCREGMWNEDGTLKQPLTDPIPREKRQAGGVDATCVPGKSFKLYCNTCRCGPEGMRKSAGCTLMGCPEGMWNEDGTLKQPQTDPIPREKRQAGEAEATCVPGKSFKHYCNTCRCGTDGLRASAACTRAACPEDMWNEDGSLKQPQTDPIPREKRQAGGVDATCVPGKSFKLYCNSCMCPKSGLRSAAGCTLMGCPEGMWTEDGTLKQPQTDPIPREKRQADGADATCVPGTSFKLYCNSCMCPTSGLRSAAGCTLMGCPEGMWNEDGTLKQPQTDPIPREKRQAGEAEATCVPGKSFKHYCNTCRCGTDGLRASAACTEIGCPEDVYKDYGSFKH